MHSYLYRNVCLYGVRERIPSCVSFLSFSVWFTVWIAMIHMLTVWTWMWEFFQAFGALEGLLAGMQSLVLRQMMLVLECFRTILTFIRTLTWLFDSIEWKEKREKRRKAKEAFLKTGKQWWIYASNQIKFIEQIVCSFFCTHRNVRIYVAPTSSACWTLCRIHHKWIDLLPQEPVAWHRSVWSVPEVERLAVSVKYFHWMFLWQIEARLSTNAAAVAGDGGGAVGVASLILDWHCPKRGCFSPFRVQLENDPLVQIPMLAHMDSVKVIYDLN